MKKALFILMASMLLFVQSSWAHGPTRQKLVETIDINASPDAVWALIKDFSNMSWHPAVAGTQGSGGTEKGATRELTLKSGGVIKEELNSYDAEKKSYSYKITDVDPAVLPVATYTSTIAVEAEGAGTRVKWSGAFYRSFMNNNPPPDQNEEAAIKAVTQIYQTGLANLKQLAEKK